LRWRVCALAKLGAESETDTRSAPVNACFWVTSGLYVSGGFRRLLHCKDLAMAEINKLSVGEALDKLRRTDVQSKEARRHEKMDALDEEIQRMKATRRRLEQDQRAAASTASDAQGNAGPGNKKGKLIWTALTIVASLLLALVILYATLAR